MGKRRTPEEFKKEFNEKANGQYILLSGFTRMDKKVKVRHEKCGREYEVEARSFLRGSRCASCANPLKKTQEQFIREIKEKTNGKYTVVGKYINRETKVEIKCTTCNELKTIIPDKFLTKQTKCKKCTETERAKKKQERYEKIKEKKKQRYSTRSTHKKKVTHTSVTKKTALESHSNIGKIFVESLGDNYSTQGSFSGFSSEVIFKHKTCGHEWKTTPLNFIEIKNKCPKCREGKPIEYNYEKLEEYSFVAFLEKEMNGEYIAISDFVSYSRKMKLKHTKCNKTIDITPRKFMEGDRECSNCKKPKLTIKDFLTYFKENMSKEFVTLGKAEKLSQKIKVKHLHCGYVWSVTPTVLMKNKNKCPDCRKSKKTNEQFLKEVESQVGNEYTFLETYKTSDSYLKVVHNNCGYRYKIKPSNFLGQKNRCPKCAGRLQKDTKQFKEEMLEKYGKEYEVLGEYIKAREKILIKHNKCGYEWDITPDQILRRKTCPQCSTSKGEEKVSDLLDRFNCSYEHQYSHSDCKNKKPLPFDFVVFNPDKSINCLIEYDGKQHFQAIEYFGGEVGFEYRRHNDQIKNDYCKKNNIPLIRIPYWEFDNIETILETELTKLGSLNKSESQAS